MDPVVELLDRQAAFLLRQTQSAAPLTQVELSLRTLRSDPRIEAHLEDVLEELAGIVGAMEEVDAELVEVRRELVDLPPGLDNSGLEPSSAPCTPAARRRIRRMVSDSR